MGAAPVTMMWSIAVALRGSWKTGGWLVFGGSFSTLSGCSMLDYPIYSAQNFRGLLDIDRRSSDVLRRCTQDDEGPVISGLVEDADGGEAGDVVL